MNNDSSTQAIRFFHRGKVVDVTGAHPTRSVLEWLREDARCTGTKEGCNEGDCGACTVVVGEVAAAGDPEAVRGLRLETVNACIRFLPTLDGRALFTVEDLKTMSADALHPVQEAMVACHGSQCGFCTPGFVMSMWNAYEHHQARETVPTRQEMADELSGNLCRCTGYRPILDAGQRMFDLPPVALDTAPVLTALQALRHDEPLAYRRSGAGDCFMAPRTIDELASLRQAHPEARLLAGATDIGVWVNKLFRPLGDILYLGEVAELKRIEQTNDGMLRIGAGASLQAAWTAIVERVPALADVWLRFASPPIRHAGTMGGNVANGSPIGDAPPVLMALDAQIELRQGDARRRLPLADFYLAYMTNRMEPGEFIEAILVPLDGIEGRRVRAYKISKRFDSDISALLGAFAIEVDDQTGLVRTVRLAFGGMAATCRRATGAEAAILGRPWTQASVDAAKAALVDDFTPLSDMRASAAYRLQVAQNLVQRYWLETRADDPLPPSSTSVFSVMPHASPARTARGSPGSPNHGHEATVVHPLLGHDLPLPEARP